LGRAGDDLWAARWLLVFAQITQNLVLAKLLKKNTEGPKKKKKKPDGSTKQYTTVRLIMKPHY
jgi:hypothetical protein